MTRCHTCPFVRAIAALASVSACCAAWAAEPHGASAAAPRAAFLADATWPDERGVHINAHGGGVLAHNGVYYWFGEHKVAGRRGNSAQVGVHCYTSTDLYNWRDAGIALAVAEDPDSEIRRGCIIERPKVVHNPKTGEFVMWFHLELWGAGYGSARTGVAVAREPTGPYHYLRSFRPNAGAWPRNLTSAQRQASLRLVHDDVSDIGADQIRDGYFVARDHAGGQMSRDMTVFVDDDGVAYHVHAAEENYTLHISELTPDYRDFTGRYVRALPGGHNEAPAIFKRDRHYYLIASGCTGWKPNAARSAVAESIWGPWRLLGNPCVGANPANGFGPERTFGGQSTYVLPIAGTSDRFVAMFDVWRPRNPIAGEYLWLPLTFTSDGGCEIHFQPRWRWERD